MKPFKFSSGAYLFLYKDGKVLLLRRANTRWMSGMYGTISGFIDGNETIKHAMIREAKEESGVKLLEDDVDLFHVMHRKSGNSEFIDFYALATKWIGEPKNIETNKCDNMRWFSISNLPDNIIPHFKNVLEYWKTKLYISEYGF